MRAAHFSAWVLWLLWRHLLCLNTQTFLSEDLTASFQKMWASTFAKEKKYDSYAVERRKYGDFQFVDLASVEEVEYKDTDLKEDTVYFYRVMNCIEKDGKTYYIDGTACKEN